jgi:hypothetical protein
MDIRTVTLSRAALAGVDTCRNLKWRGLLLTIVLTSPRLGHGHVRLATAGRAGPRARPVWYGMVPLLPPVSVRVVASCSVHPVTRVSEQHRQACNLSLFVRRWVRHCDAGNGNVQGSQEIVKHRTYRCDADPGGVCYSVYTAGERRQGGLERVARIPTGDSSRPPPNFGESGRHESLMSNVSGQYVTQ